MEVLHICSGYPDTKLYQNLVKELDHKNIKQLMYVPYNSDNIKNKRILTKAKNVEYVFSSPFNKLDRILYYTKINKIYKDIVSKVELEQTNIVHAHFLFSNGGVAYRLKKEYGIDYIVAVRNTDVNYFFKYAKHLRKYGVKIIKEAKKVIFISPSYKEYVIEQFIPSNLQERVRTKSYVIPNGIDEFWLDNINVYKRFNNISPSINLIFVGELNKNKNVVNSIKALNVLKKKGYDVQLDIIGEGPLESELKELINSTENKDNITMHGYINNKNKLMELYRKSDIFIMPSHQETFGLVYIEAMSQGLPVIYSKGQGIDGYFGENEIGVAVSSNNIEEIADGVITIEKNYKKMYDSAIRVVSDFSWSKIARDYVNIYE